MNTIGKSMKRTRNYSSALIAYALLISPNLYAQQTYDTVYQIYYEISMDPRSGDQIIINYQQLFDVDFYSCIDSLESKFERLSADHARVCDQHADPHYRALCNNENEDGKMHHWLETLEQATRGDVQWSTTIMGQAQIIAQDSLPPAQYRQIVTPFVTAQRQNLLCIYK